MSPKFDRQTFLDGSFLEMTIEPIHPDRWRKHGVRYRLAWIQDEKCRVLFDNHHGKSDHCHLDGVEMDYQFSTVEQLLEDFPAAIRNLGGPL